MNKLKEKIAELRDHLGRDVRGLALLDDVTKVANQQRKDLAMATEQYCNAVRLKNVVNGSLNEAITTIATLKESVIHERSLRDQRDRDIAELRTVISRLEKRIDELTPTDFPVPERTERVTGITAREENEPSLVRDLRPLVSAFNALRGRMRLCPTPVNRKNSFFATYEITDIIDDLSGDELMKLGAFVACMALFNFPCLVQSQVTARDPINRNKLPDESMEPFIAWIRRCIERPVFPALMPDGTEVY